MYEYTLINNKTGEEIIKWGYSNGYNHEDVFKRNNLDRADWNIVIIDYID